MSCRDGAGRIGSKQLRLAEAGGDGSILDATKLLYGELWCGQGMVHTLEGGCESAMS